MMRSRKNSDTSIFKKSNSLKKLSDLEKLQLIELQKTREKIVEKIGKTSGKDELLLLNTSNLLDTLSFSHQSPLLGLNTLNNAPRETSISGTFSTSGSPVGKKTIRHQSSPKQKPKMGLQMVPVLTQKGDAAIGIRQSSENIRLPIFHLPTIDSQKINQENLKRTLEKNARKSETVPEFVPYYDMNSFRLGLIVMIHSISQKEKRFIQSFFHMNDSDFTDIEEQLSKKSKQGSFSNDKNNQNYVKLSIFNDFFDVVANKSVFNSAKDLIMEEIARKNDKYGNNSISNGSVGSLASILRTVENPADLAALGLSDDMQVYLQASGPNPFSREGRILANQKPMSSHERETQQEYRTIMREQEEELKKRLNMRKNHSMPLLPNRYLNDNTHKHQQQIGNRSLHTAGDNPFSDPNVSGGLLMASTLPGKHYSSPYHNQSGKFSSHYHDNRVEASFMTQSGNLQIPLLPQPKKNKTQKKKERQKMSRLMVGGMGEQNVKLANELMNSLKSMQHHSSMIKKGLVTVRELVDTGDPKAKSVLYAVAAEKLQGALYKIVLIELKRGIIAWRREVRQQRRMEKVKFFIKHLVARNIVLGLKKLLRNILQSNINIWKNFTKNEKLRIQKERVLKAAIRIQCVARRRRAKRKVILLMQRRKYQSLYDATVRLQSAFRGRLTRWDYLKKLKAYKQFNAAVTIQCALRTYLACKRVNMLRRRRNNYESAVFIQKMMRSYIATQRIRKLLLQKKQLHSSIRIQSIIRGFVTRKNINKLLIEKAKYRYAVRIQAILRGARERLHIKRKIAEIEEYKRERHLAAQLLQSVYRGYRSRLMYQMMLFRAQKAQKMEFQAATLICNLVRRFLSRLQYKDLKQQRFEEWVEKARKWVETWSEEDEKWYYYNEETGEALWAPNRDGYMKNDGMLVLPSGEVIEDPETTKLLALENKAADGEESGLSLIDKKRLARLCSECQQRTAIRNCEQCGDKFCTKCYKTTHATGSRRNHTYSEIGPKDCTECEERLAERWCVSCDENFCDHCWRKVHSHGKRVFHPYSDITPEGRVDERIFTMDGEQLEGYDSSFSQQRLEKQNHENQMQLYQDQSQTQSLDYSNYDYSLDNSYETSGYDTTGYDENNQNYEYDQGGYDNSLTLVPNEHTSEWEEYQDENGYTYYYNNYTGVSQYESPY